MECFPYGIPAEIRIINMISKIISFIQKTAAKLLAVAVTPLGMAIILILALMYFGGPLTASFASGNLGNWDVQSYSNGELVLSIGTVNVHSPGNIGGYSVSARGTSAIANQADCQAIGWSWDGEERLCKAANENWLIGKTYTSDITCTCTYWPSTTHQATQLTKKYSPAFNGVVIGEFSPDEACTSVPGRTTPVCTGTITVKVPVSDSVIPTKTEKEAEAESGLQAITISETDTTKTIAYDCNSNVQCITTCGSATPTCQSGKCYCDAKIKTDVVEKTEASASNLSLSTRIKLFFGNIAYKFSSFVRGIFT
jgi:hypothetical protein